MSIFERIDEFRLPGESNNIFRKRLGIQFKTFLDMSRGATPRLVTIKTVASNAGATPSYLAFGTGPRTSEEAAAVENFLSEYRKSGIPA